MALNKAKVLKVAEKYVIQGKISHAISEYQKLIKEDPTDLPLVNTLGDLYVRIGNVPEAVRCFTRLAESYDNGGFVVRAIAMYKKVSKIDSTQIQSSLRLADLYLRQGLNSEARTNFLQVADHFIKKSDWENAAAVLQRVIEVDPDNASIEGRIGDVYLKLGNTGAAFTAFLSSGRKARNRGAMEEAENYLKKALELEGTNVQAVIQYAEVLGELGRSEDAQETFNRIPFHEFNPEVMVASFQFHLKGARLDEAEKIAFHLIELDPSYLHLVPQISSCLIQNDSLDQACSLISRITELSAGKTEGATVESQLKEILRRKEDHIPAILELIKYYSVTNQRQYIPSLLERAGGLYTRNQQFEEAASLFIELVELEPNDPVHRENLRQVQEHLGDSIDNLNLPKLVPDMKVLSEKFISEPTLKTITETKSGDAQSEDTQAHGASQEQVKGYMVEGDLFAGYGLFHKAIEQYRRITDRIPSHIEAHEKIRDMYAKCGQMVEAAQECLVLANIYTARGDNDNASRNFTLAYQYDPDLHQKPIYQDQPPAEPEHPSAGPAEPREEVPSSNPGPADGQKTQELLQEVDFYLDLGFLTEAKNSIDHYLSLSESDPDIQKRLERYGAMLGAQAGSAVESPAGETISAASTGNRGGGSVEEFETNQVSAVEDASDVSEIEIPAGLEPTSLAEPDVQDHPAALDSGSQTDESFDEMMIDLDQELDDSSLKPMPMPSFETGAPRTISAADRMEMVPEGLSASMGLDDVFEEFKQGFEDDSGDGDFETHYSLGIAFREMGLLEEAIAEFQKAMQNKNLDVDGEDFVKCCNLLGLCFVEKGLPQVAIKWFTKGLSSKGHSEETYQALRYDLACAQELAGNNKAALDTFLDVYGVNINYRDVADKIDTLKNRVNGQ
ncbi:MAG: tetratricopeptide repeat protein [Terriglobia bacterium]